MNKKKLKIVYLGTLCAAGRISGAQLERLLWMRGYVGQQVPRAKQLNLFNQRGDTK